MIKCSDCGKPIVPYEEHHCRTADTLRDMTQARWNAMTPAQKDALRSTGALTPQLIGLEGWRVEAITKGGTRKRFYVGRSTGWIPIHLEILRNDSSGGFPAESEYASVRRLYKRK